MHLLAIVHEVGYAVRAHGEDSEYFVHIQRSELSIWPMILSCMECVEKTTISKICSQLASRQSARRENIPVTVQHWHLLGHNHLHSLCDLAVDGHGHKQEINQTEHATSQTTQPSSRPSAIPMSEWPQLLEFALLSLKEYDKRARAFVSPHSSRSEKCKETHHHHHQLPSVQTKSTTTHPHESSTDFISRWIAHSGKTNALDDGFLTEA